MPGLEHLEAQSVHHLGKNKNKTFEPRPEKTGLLGFRPGTTQTGLYSHRRLLETSNFGFGK